MKPLLHHNSNLLSFFFPLNNVLFIALINAFSFALIAIMQFIMVSPLDLGCVSQQNFWMHFVPLVKTLSEINSTRRTINTLNLTLIEKRLFLKSNYIFLIRVEMMRAGGNPNGQKRSRKERNSNIAIYRKVKKKKSKPFGFMEFSIKQYIDMTLKKAAIYQAWNNSFYSDL